MCISCVMCVCVCVCVCVTLSPNYRWLRVVLIYIISGIGGFLTSGIFDASSISVSMYHSSQQLSCMYVCRLVHLGHCLGIPMYNLVLIWVTTVWVCYVGHIGTIITGSTVWSCYVYHTHCYRLVHHVWLACFCLLLWHFH